MNKAIVRALRFHAQEDQLSPNPGMRSSSSAPSLFEFDSLRVMAGLSNVHHTPDPATQIQDHDSAFINTHSETSDSPTLFGSIADDVGAEKDFSWSALLAKVDDPTWLW